MGKRLAVLGAAVFLGVAALFLADGRESAMPRDNLPSGVEPMPPVAGNSTHIRSGERSSAGAPRKRAYYTPLSSLSPMPGDATQVVDMLEPRARMGEAAAALGIYMKVNDCRLRLLAAAQGASDASLTTIIPRDCQGLTPEDYQAAGKWLEAAADAGNIDAQFIYSAFPEGVLGPPAEWLRHPEALVRYKRKAMAFMEAHAASGSIDALLDLSTAYDYGVLARRDPISALAYYRAAQMADASAISVRLMDRLQRDLSPSDVSEAEKKARSIYVNCCE